MSHDAFRPLRPTSQAALGGSIGDIVGLGTTEEMLWIETKRYIAMMKREWPRTRNAKQISRDTMDQTLFPGIRHHAITALVLRAFPQPTSPDFVNTPTGQ